jgi:hypothetical protein
MIPAWGRSLRPHRPQPGGFSGSKNELGPSGLPHQIGKPVFMPKNHSLGIIICESATFAVWLHQGA